MSDPKPNLFIIGAAKSGTTSLHHYLSEHPDVFMSDPKEPGFFARGFEGFPKDEGWYRSLFEEGATCRYRGESSTHYTKLPTYSGAAEGIAAYCDRPRLIYLMRDPIDRAISHYWHGARQNAEFRSPLRAIKEGVQYKAYGEYDRQLRPFLRRFPPETLFITTFEELVARPREVTSDVFAWLDLDPERAPRSFPAENTTPGSIERMAVGQRLGEFLHKSRAWETISPLLPQAVKDIGRELTTREFSPSKTPMDDVVSYLRPWAQDVAARTGELLEREFPQWTNTQGTR